MSLESVFSSIQTGQKEMDAPKIGVSKISTAERENGLRCSKMQVESDKWVYTRRQIKKYDKANSRDRSWEISRGDIIRKYSRTRSAKLLLEHGRWIVLEKRLMTATMGNRERRRVYYVCVCLSFDERLNSTSQRVGRTCTIPATMLERDYWEKVVETGLSWEDENAG